MNKQRTVIYAKRSHALFGDRLALDLDNGFYNIAERVIITNKSMQDYEGFKLASISKLCFRNKNFRRRI